MRHLLRLALPSSGPLGGSCGASETLSGARALPAGERLAAAAVVAFLLLALFA